MNPEFSCEVSGFAGMEQEILRLRNSNRDNDETAAYLGWRYQSSPASPPPCIYWLRAADGERIGMAAAIFRPYWVQGTLRQVAVIGDISLDARWRGRGLGQMLLRFMTEHLDEHFADHLGLVIPTESARRSLERCGWVTAGELSPLAYVVDAARYLQPYLRSAALARAAARVIRSCVRPLIQRHAQRDGVLLVSDLPDPALDDFTRTLADRRSVMRDLAAHNLAWRYMRHPHTQFRFATFRRAGTVRAFLVFEEGTHAGTCTIYDVAAASAPDLRALLALFMLRALSSAHLSAIRVLLDAHHPWRGELRRVGFIARPAEAVFQVHARDGSAAALPWRMSQGDKDT
jgi:GNAT superfamily N-acetyltransferase